MIAWWAKIFPYWIVVRIMRNSGSTGKLKTLFKEYDVKYIQIDEGEFVLFSKEIQYAFDEKAKQKRADKLNKKLVKINDVLNEDECLKRKLGDQFELERELTFE